MENLQKAIEEFQSLLSLSGQLNEINQQHAEFEDQITRLRNEKNAHQYQIGQLELSRETINRTLSNLNDIAASIRNRLITLEKSQETGSPDPHVFHIDPYNPDESWEKAIEVGQKIQEEYWHQGEEKFTNLYGPSPTPDSPGWYGTVHMPVITLMFGPYEYNFQNSARIPGMFQVRNSTRWGGAIRFHATGDKVLRINPGFGYYPHRDPVGFYVEPATKLSSGMEVRPFKQDIRHLNIVGQNGTCPIYIASNPDRLHIIDNNIQAHQGAMVSVFHGPIIEADWMPESARPDDDVFLAEARINGNQIEGPHRMHSQGSLKQAGIFYSGQCVETNDNTFFGYSQCIYSHGGRGRISRGNKAYAKPTSDGRVWANENQLCGTTMCVPVGSKAGDDWIGDNVGGDFKDLMPAKRARVDRTGGWHSIGEYYL
jgi:hypothetical protein